MGCLAWRVRGPPAGVRSKARDGVRTSEAAHALEPWPASAPCFRARRTSDPGSLTDSPHALFDFRRVITSASSSSAGQPRGSASGEVGVLCGAAQRSGSVRGAAAR